MANLSAARRNPSFSSDSIVARLRRPNNGSTTLIWFDSHITIEKEVETMVAKLRQINDHVILHQDPQECVADIRANETEKIFFVVCGSQAPEILPLVASLSQVHAIFIFCVKKSNIAMLSQRYAKVVDNCIDLGSLYEAIHKHVHMLNKKREMNALFGAKQKSTKNLSEETVEFRWFQIFIHVIARLPRDEQAKIEMIEECRSICGEGSSDLIDKFERTYDKDGAIEWYSKESFIYRLVNLAFRLENIDHLYKYRLFIGDLSDCIAREHRLLLASNKRRWIVYRGTRLSKEEFAQLKDGEGKHHSMNGFVSTSRLEQVALNNALNHDDNSDLVPVLFEIDCDVESNGDQVQFADIRYWSDFPDEQEILFNVNTTFFIHRVRLDSITMTKSLETKQIWRVSVSTSSNGQMITHPYIEETCRHIDEMSAPIVFGRLMCNKGQYNEALVYFQKLLKHPGKTDHAWIEFNIGRCYRFKGQLEKARKYYDLAYDQMMNGKQKRVKDSARIVRNIGKVLRDQGNYPEALRFYRRALEIQEVFYDAHHPDIANSFTSIGSILDDQGDYDQALDYFKRALQIQKIILPINHPDIANTLSHIGTTLKNKLQYNEALDHYRQALQMREKVLPPDHPDIANDVVNLASIFKEQGKLTAALDFYQTALDMQRKLSLPEHWHIAHTLNGMGSVFEYQRNYSKALKFYQEALSMLQDSLPEHHPYFACSYTLIGTVLQYQGDYEKAFGYFQKAFDIREKSLPPNHPHVGDSACDLGQCCENLQKPKKALKYYQRALVVYAQCLMIRSWCNDKVKERIRRLTRNK